MFISKSEKDARMRQTILQENERPTKEAKFQFLSLSLSLFVCSVLVLVCYFHFI